MCLPPGFLSNDRGFDHMTAKRYFPATEEEDIGFSEHEDSNCITFIFQDGVGGLEGLKNGRWVPAEHVDGSIIVNIGDVMQVLSNGKLKSATHRVVRKLVNRHSFAFFFNLHATSGSSRCRKIGEAPHYRKFLYKEYQQLRVRMSSV
ncbi:unnamed protein product [Urochloa humidicola]